MLWRGALVVMAGLAAFAPLSPGAVEDRYSNLAYPRIQQALTSFSNRVPIALFDLLLIAVVAWWMWSLGRDIAAKRPVGWLRVLSALAVRIATTAATLYLAFLALWGLNYRREPLVDKLRFEPESVSAAGALALAYETVDQLNHLYDAAHSLGWKPAGTIDGMLAEAFRRAVTDLGVNAQATVPGVPKSTMFDAYFRRAGVAGMTDPYFLETLVSSDLLAFERPAVTAHEWSHLAGIANEGEANFAGWLTCLRGTPAHQYSGWLFLYGELGRAIGGAGADTPALRLLPGPRRDLLAIRERLERHVSPRISAAGWRVYDGYLKANRVEQGAASYAEVVRLVLGVRFEKNWVPVRASREPR